MSFLWRMISHGCHSVDKILERCSREDVEKTVVESRFDSLFQQLHDVQLRGQANHEHGIFARLGRVKQIVKKSLSWLLSKDLELLENENYRHRFG